MCTVNNDDVKQAILKKNFGYSCFRPGQAEIIDAALDGRDVLAVLPTGAGKSLCYQIPALLLEGFTLVISPLISLMKDQVEELAEAGIPAIFLNSSLSYNDYNLMIRSACEGAYKIVYIAPERLSPENLARLTAKIPLSMLVIDEAHCVSQWGHDFRPSYLRIAECINSLRIRPIIAAFTATATPRVKEDIIRSLEMRDYFYMSTGFDRPNLYFAVQKPLNKTKTVLDYLHQRKASDGTLNSSGIIYCATRKVVEELCTELNSQGFLATRYHAGLDDAERHANQDDFIYDRKDIMVATNAFGMGINKPNVSFVIHYNMPKNIESYYQEAGRAGRDGSAADCILLYSAKDIQTNGYLIKKTGNEEERDEAIIKHNLELLKQMTFYATTADCLRARLLAYFNDTSQNYCGYCSNCTTHFEEADISIDAQKIISCVMRLAQRGRRLGKGMILQILRGSSGEKIFKESFNTLSTYALMADTSARRCREILDYLITGGYLAVEGDSYPVIVTTEKSGEIVFEKKRIVMMLAKEEDAESRHQHSCVIERQDLFDSLKKCRLKLAREANVPAYIIFNDSTLQAMCAALPATRAAFLEIPGVGTVKAEKYGTVFIECIRQYMTETAKSGESSAD